MQKLLAFLYFLFLSFTSFSQDNMKFFIKLDTIISSALKIDNESISFYDLKTKILGENLWIFYPNWVDNDSIHFLKVNLITKKKTLVNLYLPGSSLKTKSPNITKFDINDSNLVILFSNSFAYFNKSKKQYLFSFIEPLSYSYSEIFLLPKHKVLIANLYDIHPFSNPDKVILNVYDCHKKELIRSVKPFFNSIEFSHFDPNSWIDVTHKNIILSQTTNYKATFFDFNLNQINYYSFEEKNWLYADTNYIKNLSRIKPRIEPKELIGKITQMKDTVSRIEAIFCLGTNKILVRKVASYNKKLNRIRFYDLLTLNKKNKWEITRQNLIDDSPKPEDTCKKNSFPIFSVEETVVFSEKYYVKLTERFNNFEFGKTFAELKKTEDASLGNKDPYLFIEIFNLNFN